MKTSNVMNRCIKIILIFLFFSQFCFSSAIKWNISYTDRDSATNWHHLSPGRTTAILTLIFKEIVEIVDSNYTLSGLMVEPITNFDEWCVDSISLWKDDGNQVFSQFDTLISSIDFDTVSIDTQENPDISLAFSGINSFNLADKDTFFITVSMPGWTYLDSIGIINERGYWFSVFVSKQDISVIPEPDHTIFTPPGATEHFYIQAFEQEIFISDSSGECNTFLPVYLDLNGDSLSKSQKLTDLEFDADVFLPGNYDIDTLSLKSFSVSIGYDNTILDIDFGSIYLGNLWVNHFSDVETNTSICEEIEDITNYSVIKFEGSIDQSINTNTKFEKIDSSSIAQFKFRVIKPGISPIFLHNFNLIDRWGIPYHLQEHDAQAKFILGDFRPKGECDGKVEIEDISAFANNIWYGISDTTNWYSRFDIGSPDSHNPDELSPDDTTNFFDLMIMGINYYRTLAGSFNQKPVSVVSEKIDVSLSELEQIDKSDQYFLKLTLRNTFDLSSIHAKIHYNPEDLEFFNIEAGNWVKNVSPNHLLLFPPELVNQGKIDINFIALDKPLCGEGNFALIRFKRLKNGEPDVTLEYLEFRNTDCERVEYVIKGNDDIKELPSELFFLKNYPNPFNPNTEISYIIPGGKDDIYKLEIYDIAGKLVKTLSNSYHTTGRYRQLWDGKNMDKKSVGSGIYFLCLSSYNFTKTMKIMLMR